MIKLFQKYSLTIYLFSLTICTNAQSTVVSAGGDAVTADASFAFTVGQVGYTYYALSSTELSSGIQFGLVENGELTENNLIHEINGLEVYVYPNPTTDYCTVRVKEDTKYIYKLTDITGRVWESGVLVNGTKLSLDFPKGVYVLNVTDQMKRTSSVRIVKE